ncbi:phosphodiester glycosidase family protein [Agrobacterium sp. ES01]|uniref:phosphodiester glycosidase family protein n=1 Tax=Agrobacterium sp. ES01 TaxID=3420714 RepID=UPI003D0D14A1
MKLVALLAVLIAFAMAPAAAAQPACETMEKSGVDFTVCRFDPAKDDIRLFNRAPDGAPFGSFDALKRQLWIDRHYLRFAMNGGMFERDLSPVGLYVENGIRLKAASTAKGWGNFHLLPNGVFALGGREARIAETHRYLQSGFQADYATQSGPMLVIDGKIHPRFLPDSDSLKRRNGVGIDDQGRVVFVLARQPVRFYDFATLFRDRLDCANALFLDGTISSVYQPDTGRNDRLFSLGPMIAVVGRAPD